LEFEVRFDKQEFTIEDDEKWEAFLSFIREREYEQNKKGVMLIINPKKVQLLQEMLQKLKRLLDENGFDYKLKVDRIRQTDTELYITLVLEYFGVAPKDYHFFKDIINSIDTISIVPTLDGKVDISMAINDMFIKAK